MKPNLQTSIMPHNAENEADLYEGVSSSDDFFHGFITSDVKVSASEDVEIDDIAG